MRLSIMILSVAAFAFAFVALPASVKAADKPAMEVAPMNIVGFCLSCHGDGGVSAGESIPSIAGQTKEYLEITLIEMRNKTRRATLMQTIAQGYTPEEIAKISEYYSKLKWQAPTEKADPKLVAKGKVISESCEGCHTDNGIGSEETPRIADQQALYLYNALLEYKKGERNNDEGGELMRESSQISDEDLKAVSEYYSSIK